MSKRKQGERSFERVVCSKCNKNFTIKLRELEFIKDGLIEIEGFQCPHCQQRYITVVTDNELRQSIYEAAEVKRQLADINKRKDREYSAYIEDMGQVPMAIVNKYAKDLQALQVKYELLCKYNQNKGQELKAKFCNKE